MSVACPSRLQRACLYGYLQFVIFFLMTNLLAAVYKLKQKQQNGSGAAAPIHVRLQTRVAESFTRLPTLNLPPLKSMKRHKPNTNSLTFAHMPCVGGGTPRPAPLCSGMTAPSPTSNCTTSLVLSCHAKPPFKATSQGRETLPHKEGCSNAHLQLRGSVDHVAARQGRLRRQRPLRAGISIQVPPDGRPARLFIAVRQQRRGVWCSTPAEEPRIRRACTSLPRCVVGG